MARAYYSAPVSEFLSQDRNYILGVMAQNNTHDLEELQRNAWLAQIDILKQELAGLDGGHIAFEYSIPRMGKRIDNVLIYHDCIYLLEFKVGANEYSSDAVEQVTDYALDLQNFHYESRACTLIPVLVATRATSRQADWGTGYLKPQLHDVIRCNADEIHSLFKQLHVEAAAPVDALAWLDSPYSPTPTIIEAAQVLYQSHGVVDISHNSAGATNLTSTSNAIYDIVERCQRKKEKAICFITGVPGAGKTLAGLNIANKCHSFSEDKHAVFLSGNGPLVDVLREALARDEKERLGIKKTEAMSHVKAFIQPIHHFRDHAVEDERATKERVAIFDEAQRAWNMAQLSQFMHRKKGIPDFVQSEPEFLIGVMDRHEDWAVIVCLVGGGQEINTGEAGITEWFRALQQHHPDWKVYLSDRITDSEYAPNGAVVDQLQGLNYYFIPELHLAVSLRSYRSESVSLFVKKLLDNDFEGARELYQQFKDDFPIHLTRSYAEAKAWIKDHACGSERYGVVACSSAVRLKPYGIWVNNTIDAPTWFLNPKTDIRSSYYMEDVATEFDIQGLELDWVLMAWDANLRIEDGKWAYYGFTGTKWNKPNPERTAYLKNAYRVLLTRARQGMVIFVPEGDAADATCAPEFYDGIYQSLLTVLGD